MSVLRAVKNNDEEASASELWCSVFACDLAHDPLTLIISLSLSHTPTHSYVCTQEVRRLLSTGINPDDERDEVSVF